MTPAFLDIIQMLRHQALSDGLVDPGLPAPLREAQLFHAALSQLPIGLSVNGVLAGEIDWKFFSEEQQQSLSMKAGNTPSAARHEATQEEKMWDNFHCGGNYTLAHTCADYQRIIEHGLVDVLEEIGARRRRGSAVDQVTLDAMQVSVEAVGVLAQRFAILADGMAESQIAEACRVVPMQPARTFQEAVQSLWFVHLCIGISEQNTASLSLGRPDQFLLPLFRKDLAAGVPRAVLKCTLVDLWEKLNRFGDAACAVNLGGLDDNGNDLFNELSALILEVEKELALPSPIIAARIHDKLPPAMFDALLDPRLFAIGQPSFYGELSCREAMIRRGVPADRAAGFAVNSCMGLLMPGEEISDMWGAIVNLPVALELALNHGKPFMRDLPIVVSSAGSTPTSFDELFQAFEIRVNELIDYGIAGNTASAANVAAEAPNPFLSAITRGCVERVRDRAAAGADFHSVIVEGFGWANVSDALVVIQRLVFDERRFTLDELVSAAKDDYRGRSDILARIRTCPTYGNNNAAADDMAARVSRMFAQAVSRHSHGNIRYLPSYHTLNCHVDAGRKTSATLDGRRAGAPLGKQLGPTPGRAVNGLTAILLSAGAIDQRALSGGQALDLSVDTKELEDPAWRRGFQALLLSYFQLGGMQIQVNGLSAAHLREAIRTPELHADLVVRIAGYSARFTSLDRPIQEEMVSRFEQGL